ncbi:MAG TPA: SLC13 family permease, partial [Actinomycetales bacterium]|nr:SLC13 family permease [Actinomycetales bacterium]
MRATAVPVLSAAHTASNGQLIIAALVGIAVIVLLITWAKFHPFIALILGSGALAVVAAYPADKAVTSFSTGVGSTVASVGVLIALGAMIGKLLSDSGGGETIVERITSRFRDNALPWAMALIAGIIGLPLFFEVGVVLLVPVVLLVAKRTGMNLMKIGIPALAGLSILHGFVPPHPGPLVAIATLNVDLGLTLILGLVVAVPTLVICGPLLGNFIARIVHAEPPMHLIPASAAAAGGARTPARHVTGIAAGAGTTDLRDGAGDDMDDDTRARLGTAVEEEVGEPVAPTPPSEEPGPTRRPGFGASIIAVVLPVLLMLARAVGEIT